MNYKNIGIILSFILSSQKVFSIPNVIGMNEEEVNINILITYINKN